MFEYSYKDLIKTYFTPFEIFLWSLQKYNFISFIWITPLQQHDKLDKQITLYIFIHGLLGSTDNILASGSPSPQ